MSTHPKMTELNTKFDAGRKELHKIIEQLKSGQTTQPCYNQTTNNLNNQKISIHKELLSIEKDRFRIKDDIRKDIENNRQYWEISLIKPHKLQSGLSDLPNYHTIQLIESTYNMFNILTTQIEKINQRLDKIEANLI